MPAERIQADYDALQKASKTAHDHAQTVADLFRQLQQRCEALAEGGWRGKAADQFAGEMADVVLPAVARLQHALAYTGYQLIRVIWILREAELEAGALFQGQAPIPTPSKRLVMHAVKVTEDSLKKYKEDPYRLFDNDVLTEEELYTLILAGQLSQKPTATIQFGGREIGLFEGVKTWSPSTSLVANPKESADWPTERLNDVKLVVGELPKIFAKESTVSGFYWTGENANAPFEDNDTAGMFILKDMTGTYSRGSITLSLGAEKITRYGEGNGFKATVLHEMVHSIQYDEKGNHTQILKDFAKAFDWYQEGEQWKYYGGEAYLPGADNRTQQYPNLANTNPLEDMAESVAFYRYNPKSLLFTSKDRYNWVKEHIYGGQEFLKSNNNNNNNNNND
jgi:WXG100 family type VII secretion target